MNEHEFISKLQEIGLGKYADKLIPLLRNTIRFYQIPTEEDQIPIGQTKMGGRPDLPNDISWVIEDESKKSLSFIAQINLENVKPFDSENLLPESGILYFFYSAEQEAWGFDPADKDKFKVVYYEGNGKLERTDFPNDLVEYARYKPCAITIKQEISVPDYENEVVENFSNEEFDKFCEIFDGNINKLLGYADKIQGEMKLECELVTNGLYCGDPSGYNDPRAESLKANARDWRLLLQIDSNDESDMMWGDAGRLYFWIKEDDLLNRRFDKSWFILQCY